MAALVLPPCCTVRLSLSLQQVAPTLLSCHRWGWLPVPPRQERKLGSGFGSRLEECPHTAGRCWQVKDLKGAESETGGAGRHHQLSRSPTTSTHMASLASGHCEHFTYDLNDQRRTVPAVSGLSHSGLAMLQSTSICPISTPTPKQDKEAVSGRSKKGSKIVFLLQSQHVHLIHFLRHNAAKHVS